jgi:redox-sensitive bicupin YhaK (pirin superfamily)
MTNDKLMIIKAIVPMHYHAFDAHSGAHMLRVDHDWIDPFIGVDSYTMPQPFFGPHPHAGMSAVSLMLPEADGGFINRDSLGDHSMIRPGDLHWTQAGRGMMHEEVPSEPGKAARGLQIFVNLARKDKQAEPVAFKVKHEEVPVVQFAGGNLRVVTGSLHAAGAAYSSPITNQSRWLTPVNMFDVSLESGATYDIPVQANHNAFFVVRSGKFLDADQPHAQHEHEQSAIIFEVSETDRLARIQAGDHPLRGVFFSGLPIREPIHSGGPFTGNNAQDIIEYKRRFGLGEMGRLAPSF